MMANEFWARPDPNAHYEPDQWPSWRYGPGGQSAIFECEEMVPEGWAKHPSEFVDKPFAELPTPPEPELPLAEDLGREAVVDALNEAGVDYNPKWTTSRLNKALRDSKEA